MSSIPQPFQVLPGKGLTVEPFAVTALDETESGESADITQRIYGRQHLVTLVGSPNAGKTAIGIDHGLHVAAGAPWFGHKINGGPVVYFAPEAPASVIMRAKAAHARKFPGRRLPFYIARGTPALGGEKTSVLDAKRIVATVRGVTSQEGTEVKLIQIDTLASCLGDGDENGDGMLMLVAAAKTIAIELNCAVMLIHHPSKADSTGLRGHGSLGAACDSIITIAVDEASGTRTATLVKSRDSATGVQFCYALEQVTLPEVDGFGDPRTTIIVKPLNASELPRKRPGGKTQERLLNELERRYRIGETEWDRATVLKAGREIGNHRNSAAAACNGLIKSGFLCGSNSRLTLKYPPEDTCT